MRRERTTRRLALAVALATALVGFAVPAAAVPSAGPLAAVPSADDPLSPARIVIDRLSPAIPQADDVLRIEGRVISQSEDDLTDVSVQISRSAAPVDTRRAVVTVAESGFDVPEGEPADVALTATRTVVAATLPAGTRRPFEISIPVSQLGLTQSGAYVLAVEALGRVADVDEFDARQAIIRTFLPWFPPDTDVSPVDLVWLWPLADSPARDTGGILLNDSTPIALSPGGRLAELVRIGSRSRSAVSWLADPALLQTAADMTEGYQVVQDGAVTIGDRDQQARRWLTELEDATAIVGMRTLPYADVDASAVNRAGMSNDVVRALTQGPLIAAAAMGGPLTGDLYWAPFGRIDRSTLNLLASTGVSTLILSADAMPPTDEAQPTDGMATAVLPTSVGSIRAVLTDPGLQTILSLPQRSASDVVVARQRFLAETAVVAQTIPADQSSRALVVAPSSVRWSATASLVAPLLRATRSAAWLAPMSLADLLTEPPSSTSRQRGGYGEKARDAELRPSYMAKVARVSTDLDVFTSIIDDPTGISEPFSEALLRAESAAWRSDPTTGNQLVTTIADDLAAQTNRVRVLSEGTITFSGDTGRVPVTITNELDRSVTVGLELRGNPAVRLDSEPLTGIRIEPGRMASVDIDARVVGGDPLPVLVQLLGPEDVAYGEPATITLSSTAYARAAAWVVAAAFIAIVIFVVVGVTRRIRKAHAARGSGAATP